uniref:Sushi domain-containing protein n=1 Tax=Anguilla anguilla TaxID=7936 RepID=A0A0E9UTA6_ANGAN
MFPPPLTLFLGESLLWSCHSTSIYATKDVVTCDRWKHLKYEITSSFTCFPPVYQIAR